MAIAAAVFHWSIKHVSNARGLIFATTQSVVKLVNKYSVGSQASVLITTSHRANISLIKVDCYSDSKHYRLPVQCFGFLGMYSVPILHSTLACCLKRIQQYCLKIMTF